MNVFPPKKPRTPAQEKRWRAAIARKKKGFHTCVKCRKQKPDSEYGLTPGGTLVAKCQQCIATARIPKERRCIKCGVTKTVDAFDKQPNGRSLRRRKKCRDCYVPPAASRICRRCNEVLAVELFPVRSIMRRGTPSLTFQRRDICEQCYDMAPRKMRQCQVCGQKKVPERFRKVIQSAHARRCLDCPPNADAAAGLRHIRPLPDPCAACNEQMWTFRPLDKVQDVKYCSKTCSTIGATPQTVECRQCREIKPREHFTRKHRQGCRVLPICQQCEQNEAQEHTAIRHVTYGTTQQLALQRKRAQRKNLKFSLRYKQAHEILRKPCHFCGQAADALVPLTPRHDVHAGAMRGLCLSCRHMLGAHTLADFEAFAHKIATFRGWAAEAGADKGAKKLKRPLEVAPPKGLRRCDMVPREVHGAPIVGESWDERVARFAQIKGPITSKRKPSEERDYG